jgi:hypothetical protein
VKGGEPVNRRAFQLKLFDDPYLVNANDNDFPIRMVLSSYCFPGDSTGIPDGKSDYRQGPLDCSECKSRAKAVASVREK